MKTKRTALAFILIMALNVTAYAPKAYAQQYDPESDFSVSKRDNGKSIEITGYTGSKQTVNIPPTIQGLPVTSIGNEAFVYCRNLVSVTILNSVTRIGNNAFYCCNKLTSITIPNNVTSISDSAFGGCANLASVTIPASVTSIGAALFYDCYNLVSVTFQESIASENFDAETLMYPTFPGDLLDKYLAGGFGRYTRASGGR